MLRKPRNQLAIGSVVVLGLLALLQQWLAARRPLAPELRAAQELIVTSSADGGPGSLREAIFAADTAHGRVRIVLQANRIGVQSPLPPLVNPLGVVIEAREQAGEIDARSLGSGPVFDVDAPNSVIDGVKIMNAPGQGVLVRADGLRLLGAKILGCDEGLYAVEGTRNLVVERSSFENNRIGVWLATAESGIILRHNRFYRQKDAAIWAVRSSRILGQQASGFEIRGNYFENDRMSLVLGNMPGVVEENEFVKSHEAAVFLIGQGAIVRGNRIRDGAGIGVFAHTTQGVVIEANELDHLRAIAVLVRSSGSALVQKNRVYDNGYGMAFVLGDVERPSVAGENILLRQQYDGIIVIGDSPIIRRNRALNNALAGLRMLDFLPLTGARVVASPFLDNNILGGNKFNEPTRGEYRVRESEKAR